jgi:hypothetical protein
MLQLFSFNEKAAFKIINNEESFQDDSRRSWRTEIGFVCGFRKGGSGKWFHMVFGTRASSNLSVYLSERVTFPTSYHHQADGL